MINTSSDYPIAALSSGMSGLRDAVTPVAQVFPSGDAPADSSPRKNPHPSVSDLSMLERLYARPFMPSFGNERPLSSRAREAISAYGAMKDLEKKEYVSAVMGIDDFA